MADGSLSLERDLFGYTPPAPSRRLSRAAFRDCEIHLGDSLAWLSARPPNTIHAIVTDPPYGLKEFTEAEKGKLRNGRGGVWRIPASFDGCKRKPLPRFTVLDDGERRALRSFFERFAREAARVADDA